MRETAATQRHHRRSQPRRVPDVGRVNKVRKEIASNIRNLLTDRQTVSIRGSLGDVLGKTLGLARETHLRAALRLLEGEGLVEPCSKGKLDAKVITRRR